MLLFTYARFVLCISAIVRLPKLIRSLIANLQQFIPETENMQLGQEIDSLKQTPDRPICKEMSDSLNALDNAVKEQNILIIELSKKQETDRECFTRAIAELWERQELVRTVRAEIYHLRQSDQVLRKRCVCVCF